MSTTPETVNEKPKDLQDKQIEEVEEVLADLTHLTFCEYKDGCSWTEALNARFVQKLEDPSGVPQKVYSLFIYRFDPVVQKFVRDGFGVWCFRKDKDAIIHEKLFIESPQFKVDLILHESNGWEPQQKIVKTCNVKGYEPLLDHLRDILADLLFAQGFLYIWRKKPGRSIKDVINKKDPAGFDAERPLSRLQLMSFTERVEYSRQIKPCTLQKLGNDQVLVTSDDSEYSTFRELFHSDDRVILVRQDSSKKTKDCIFFQREDGKWSYAEMSVPTRKFPESVQPSLFCEHNCKIPMDCDKWKIKEDDELKSYGALLMGTHKFVILFPQDTEGNDQFKKLYKNPMCSYQFQVKDNNDVVDNNDVNSSKRPKTETPTSFPQISNN